MKMLAYHNLKTCSNSTFQWINKFNGPLSP